MKPVGSLGFRTHWTQIFFSFNRVFSGVEIFENWNQRLLAKNLPAQPWWYETK
jgi:hypothetical protein